MKIMKIPSNLMVILIAALLFGGCASVGTQISTGQLASFEQGKTTIQEVQAKLGPPTTSVSNSDGTKSLHYVYAHSQARPASFIPIIGLVAGGADTESSMVIFVFGADGKLVNYTSSTSQMGVSTGIAGGHQAETADRAPEAQ